MSRFKSIGGVVGGAGSGKDTVANIFSKEGFSPVSASDLVREEISRRGERPSRSLQTKVANELRKTFGAAYWVELSLERLGPKTKEVIISGIYSPGEGAHIKQQYEGFIVGVVTGAENDRQMRFDRIAARADGSRDMLSPDDFVAAELRENTGKTQDEVNIADLLSTATYTVRNAGSIADMEKQTLTIIEHIRRSSP